jgi:tRNA(Ile)-lysidine synthase
VGIPATIIPLTWPDRSDFDDGHSRRFESDARRLRYQALGQACKEHKIEKLLVAHHADDQAETVLMRLMNMRWRSGLQGMQAAEWIPECYGMHGVYHSGMMRMDKNLPMQVERGGIQILRPLLGFRKDRLIATCEEHHLPWAEDKTNRDHTLTLRNAIRHVFKEDRLPAALSFESLLALGNKMKERVDFHKEQAERLLATRDVIYKLDIQTGSLSVRFPPASALLGRPIVSEEDVDEARNTAYMLLVRIASFVDFRENKAIGKLSGIVPAVWPELRVDEDVLPAASNPTASFCAFGLFWRKWNEINPPSLPKSADRKINPMDWIISRQPLASHELGRTGLRLEYPPTPATLSLVPTASPSLPEWQLFDRWWFQIKNHTHDHTVVLRFLTEKELRTLQARSKGNDLRPSCDPHHNIKVSFDLIKPVSLRRTLPALFLISPSGEEELLALPTLGVQTIFSKEHPFPNPPCTWDVRYKKIDSRHRKLQAVIAPGIVPQDKSFSPQKRLTFNRGGAEEDGVISAQWSPGGKEKRASARFGKKGVKFALKEDGYPFKRVKRIFPSKNEAKRNGETARDPKSTEGAEPPGTGSPSS